MRASRAKRVFDVLCVLLASPLWLPLLAVVAVVVRLKLGAPVLFRQPRPGLHGRVFLLCKFRTMTNDREALGRLAPDQDRLTPFGLWLRSTSLDELPELWNVLRGDMSLVGPRPLLVDYLARYNSEQARRHEVKPGMTGWAQVHGRNLTTWEERFRLDVWYVDHQTLGLDIRILVRTLGRVLRREGIHFPGQATMPEFMGGSPPQRKD